MDDSSAAGVAFHFWRPYCINARRSARENINVRFSLNIYLTIMRWQTIYFMLFGSLWMGTAYVST